jgi:hypothetical protein
MGIERWTIILLASLAGVASVVGFIVLCIIIPKMLKPTTCPEPWRMADKTVLSSPLEAMLKNPAVEKLSGLPKSALRSKVVIVMQCDKLGIYQVVTETNP